MISLALIICHAIDFIFTMETVTLRHQVAYGGYLDRVGWSATEKATIGVSLMVLVLVSMPLDTC